MQGLAPTGPIPHLMPQVQTLLAGQQPQNLGSVLNGPAPMTPPQLPPSESDIASSLGNLAMMMPPPQMPTGPMFQFHQLNAMAPQPPGPVPGPTPSAPVGPGGQPVAMPPNVAPISLPGQGPVMPSPPLLGLPPPTSVGSGPGTGAGGVPDYPVGGDTGNTVVTVPGTPETPATGGVNYGDVAQVAGLGGALLGPIGLAAGALPILNADPQVPGTEGTPDQNYMVGPEGPVGYDVFGTGAAPGSALNQGGATPGVEGTQVTALNNPDGTLSVAGLGAATDAVNAVLATLPPAAAAQVVAAIQSGTDPVDALNAVRIGGNASAGWSAIGGDRNATGGFDSSVDALDAIGQGALVQGSGMELVFGPKWRSHIGLTGAAGQTPER